MYAEYQRNAFGHQRIGLAMGDSRGNGSHCAEDQRAKGMQHGLPVIGELTCEIEVRGIHGLNADLQFVLVFPGYPDLISLN